LAGPRRLAESEAAPLSRAGRLLRSRLLLASASVRLHVSRSIDGVESVGVERDTARLRGTAVTGPYKMLREGAPDPAQEAASEEASTVAMAGLAFAPREMTIDRGAKVLFDNDDVAPHTVTAKADKPLAATPGGGEGVSAMVLATAWWERSSQGSASPASDGEGAVLHRPRRRLPRIGRLSRSRAELLQA
jgi:plastocyanin